jgi:hypothetical protein
MSGSVRGSGCNSPGLLGMNGPRSTRRAADSGHSSPHSSPIGPLMRRHDGTGGIRGGRQHRCSALKPLSLLRFFARTNISGWGEYFFDRPSPICRRGGTRRQLTVRKIGKIGMQARSLLALNVRFHQLRTCRRMSLCQRSAITGPSRSRGRQATCDPQRSLGSVGRDDGPCP